MFRPLGAHALPGGTHFSLYSDAGRSCAVRVFSDAGARTADYSALPGLAGPATMLLTSAEDSGLGSALPPLTAVVLGNTAGRP
jgi:hypothetical protein